MRGIKNTLLGKLHYKFLLRSVLVLVLGVLSFELMTFMQTSRLVKELTLDKMRSSVESISARIDDELSRLRTDLYIFRDLPGLESFYLNLNYGLRSEAEQYKQSLVTFFDKQHARNPSYLAFKICDQQLKQQTIYSLDNILMSMIDQEPCTSRLSKSGKHYVLRKDLAGTILLVTTLPVHRGEQLLGYVSIFFDLSPYLKSIDQFGILQSGFIAVADEEEQSVSTNNQEKTSLLKTAFSQHSVADDYSLVTIVNSDDKKMFAYKYRMQGISWTMNAFILEEEIFSQLDQQIKLAIWLLILLIIVEILFLNFFTKRIITKKVVSLLDATKQVLSGNYQQRLPENGMDELAQLNQSFNLMTESLQSQLSALESERKSLNQNKLELQNIIDNTSALISIKNIHGHYLLINNAFTEFFNLEVTQVIGKTDYDLFGTEVATIFRGNDLRVIQSGEPLHVEESSTNSKGNQGTFIVAKFPLFDENHKIYATCGIATDISNRIKEENALQLLNAKLLLSDAVLESIDEGIVVTNANFEIIEVNPALIKLFGYSEQELLGAKPSIFRSDYHDDAFFEELYGKLKSDGSWHGEIWEKTKQGAVLPQLLTVTSMRDEFQKITHYAGIYSDISDLKQTEAKLQKLAHYDALTGLANRVLLEERTSQAILRAQRGHHKVTVLFIDLDNFKYINDTLGHDVGDKLLQKVAQRFGRILRETDTLARQGGDEFVVLLAKTQHANDAQIIANKIKAAGSLPFQVDEHELYISTSIGIAVYPDDAANTHDLLKSADMAMYAVKGSGKNNFQFYSQAMNHAAVDRLKIEKALRKAIQNDALELYYQPQVDPQTGITIKIEALLRWPQQNNLFIPPDLFVPIAEESGLIVVLGEWVLRQALIDLLRINHHRANKLALSINLSARQFRHHDIAKKLHAIVVESTVPISLIEFEITESLLVDDFELAELILLEIRKLGFTIALDDFGKGYSSLSYLTHFPIDTLKLDRVFMRNVISDKRNQAIVNACIQMGKALGMRVICEGVETKAQYSYVKSMENVLVQGYYCSKALPLGQLLEYLSKTS